MRFCQVIGQTRIENIGHTLSKPVIIATAYKKK